MTWDRMMKSKSPIERLYCNMENAKFDKKVKIFNYNILDLLLS